MENKKLTIQDVLSTIKEKRYQLDFTVDIPDEMKSNPEVIFCILEHGRFNFDELPDAAKNDREILKQIAVKNSSEFENFPDWAKDDNEIVIKAISKSSDTFEFASEKLRADRDIVILALKSWYLGQEGIFSNNLQYVSSEVLKNDKEILKIAVSGHEQAFHYVPEKWRTDKELLDILLLKKVTATYSFEHFPAEYKDNREIAIKVLNDDAGCFQYLSDRLRDDKELAILSVQKRGIYLEYASERLRDDKDVIMIALKEDTWSSLRSVSERLKNDIEVVLAYVSKDNRTLRDFPDEFKDNEKVIEACLKGDGTAYEYFSDRFKKDRKIATQMSAKWNFNLNSCPDEFKNDKEIVLNAIKESANNFKFISPELLKDISYIKTLYTVNDGILYEMSDELKNQLFTTKIFTVTHYDKQLMTELVIDDGYVKDNKRAARQIVVEFEGKKLMAVNDFSILTYEEDGPVGSYLSVRSLNNYVLCGSFIFLVEKNSGKETSRKYLTGKGEYAKYNQQNDDFLKHKVSLIDTKNQISNSKIIYFGRPEHLPNGIQIFENEDKYKEALTILKQEKTYGTPAFEKINDNELKVLNTIADELNGAARVYLDDYGWRWLIPNTNGAFAALDVLQKTKDANDWDWLKQNLSKASTHQKALLLKHFENAPFADEVKTLCN